MLVRSIRLEGWRCFSNAVSVGEFGDGLNIIHGANGTGKSTLMMALVRAMFEGSHTSGQDIESLRPWGKDLSPQVELEFEHDDARYRVVKGFLGRKGTELARYEGDRFERFKEDRNADDFLRALLAGEDVRKASSKSQHWGLAQVLWVPQGDLTLRTLAGAAKDLVQQALGAQLATVETTSIEERIQKRYEEIYTPQGRFKGGAGAARVVQLDLQVADLTSRAAQLRARLTSFEDASRRMEDLRQTAEQAGRREQEINTALDGARLKSHDYLECSGQRETRKQELSALQAKVDEARGRREAIASARKELADDEAKLERLAVDHPLLQANVTQCETREQQARAHATGVRGRREEIDIARRQAHDALSLSNATGKSQQLATQIAAIEEANRESEELRKQRGRLVAPTQKQLTALRKSHSELREARLRLEGSLITLTFEAEEQIRVTALVGEPSGNQLVETGARIVLRGSPETALHLPGVGTVRATGPIGSAEQLRAALVEAENCHQAAWSGFTSSSLEELEHAALAAQQLEAAISQLQTRVSTTLGGRTLEQLQSELAGAELTIGEVRQRQSAWCDAPPSSQELHNAAERLELAFRREIDDAEAKVELARSAHSAAMQKLSLHDAEINATLARISNTRKRLEQHTADGRDDFRRDADYQQSLLQYDLAQTKLAQAETELAAFLSDPRKELSTLEREAAALRQDVARSLESLHREDALLQQLAGEAPYSALVAAEEELATLQQQLERERLQAEAIRLLRDTLAGVKREAVQAVIEPVKRRAQQTLQRIAGAKFEGISFGDELLPDGVVPQSHNASVSLDQLSGGEREQVYFAVRLALADIAFREKQLVVLDDVFVYTDMTRIARIVNLLEEAAERFQIVLLTCHPERYRGIPTARFFDLEKIVRGDTASSPAPASGLVAQPTASPVNPPKSRAKSLPARPDRTLWESEAVP